jgi:hypothetical protein
MRDDSTKWDVPHASDHVHNANGITLTALTLTRQVLCSGPRVLAQTQLPIAGWPDIVTAQSYALSIRRDQVLLVNGPAIPEGWHDATCQAVSDASDAYAVFDISGEKSLEALKRGAELNLDIPSRSVARALFGLDVFLYRYGTENGFRIHARRSHAQALLKSLSIAIAAS